MCHQSIKPIKDNLLVTTISMCQISMIAHEPPWSCIWHYKPPMTWRRAKAYTLYAPYGPRSIVFDWVRILLSIHEIESISYTNYHRISCNAVSKLKENSICTSNPKYCATSHLPSNQAVIANAYRSMEVGPARDLSSHKDRSDSSA
jgi:hypothetical protein